ncbi:MAG: hypothetical protein HKN13_11395 [Rhodothermales bacterium]|nr:hypothetical protein [Rhodothermales bacterium]
MRSGVVPELLAASTYEEVVIVYHRVACAGFGLGKVTRDQGSCTDIARGRGGRYWANPVNQKFYWVLIDQRHAPLTGEDPRHVFAMLDPMWSAGVA